MVLCLCVTCSKTPSATARWLGSTLGLSFTLTANCILNLIPVSTRPKEVKRNNEGWTAGVMMTINLMSHVQCCLSSWSKKRTAVAEEWLGAFTLSVIPHSTTRIHRHTILLVDIIIRLSYLPVSEGGLASIWPGFPGVSGQTDPSFRPKQVLDLCVLSGVPHTGQVSVVLPAVALSVSPGLSLFYVDKSVVW